MAEQKVSNVSIDGLDGHGLILSGLVVAIEIRDKSWEGKNYKQLKATVSNGSKSWFFTQSDTQGPLPEIKPFSVVRIIVGNANTEKGNVTVQGDIIDGKAA